MLTRREFLGGAASLVTAGSLQHVPPVSTDQLVVNDVHSRLNATRVARIERPASSGELEDLVGRAAQQGRAVSVSGSRHAMGGQQFGADTVLLDMRGLSRILGLDEEKGIVTAEAGVEWPQLIEYLLRVQAGRPRPWGIVQKQTGADRLTLGGGLAANIHGRGLTLPPIVADVEAFTIVDEGGRVRRCSRTENTELFALAVGGYGLFGVVQRVELRLAPRRVVQRIVEVIDAGSLMAAFDRRIGEGYLFGDFQYMTDETADGFMRRGVFSCYRPAGADARVPEGHKELSIDDWNRLFYLSHADKRTAFEAYSTYYLSTSGQLYWSDTHQLSVYPDDYHRALDPRLGARPGTEMITEIYVPRPSLAAFLDQAARSLRENGTSVIYGTIRLIERDAETVLAWARESWACVIFNLHVPHSAAGLDRARAAFTGLIDLARGLGGSYYLTYHRWASREQVLACHPRLPEFFAAKRRYDPGERFQSDWYRHYRELVG
jgi:FAD/FMN-containing dehydrogenase